MSASVAASLGGQSRESIGAPRTDNDRFKVPPVFGLGSSAGRTAPAANPAPVAAPAPKAEPVQAHQVLPQSAEPAVVAPPAPSADDSVGLDPIDEIESLIGRAMRVEFDLPEDDAQAKPAPAPEPEAIAVAPVAAPVEPAAKPARPVPEWFSALTQA